MTKAVYIWFKQGNGRHPITGLILCWKAVQLHGKEISFTGFANGLIRKSMKKCEKDCPATDSEVSHMSDNALFWFEH